MPVLHPQQQQKPKSQSQQIATSSSMGGIGRAFNNSNNNNVNANGINNGSINVDNIFASMAEEKNHHSNTNSNNIFHNFATMNDHRRPGMITNSSGGHGGGHIGSGHSGGGGPIHVMPASNYHPRGRVIGSSNHNNHASNAIAAPSSPMTGSSGLSKSMGKASFMRRSSRSTSVSENDPITTMSTIRHAGYLLKRSNFPYVPSSSTPSAMDVAIDVGGIGSAAIADVARSGGIGTTLPDVSRVEDDINSGLFNLPFGGLEDSVDVMAGTGDAAVDSVGIADLSSTSNDMVVPSPLPEVFHPSVEPTDPISSVMTSVPTTEDTADEYRVAMASVDEGPCFCTPIVQYFEKLFRIQRRPALVTTETNGMNHPSNSIKDSSKRKIYTSPRPTRRSQPLPITPTQASPVMTIYSMPLKPPSRPVPISPRGEGNNNTTTTTYNSTNSAYQRGDNSTGGGNIGGQQQLSRSLSNGSKQHLLSTLTTTTTSTMQLTEASSSSATTPSPPIQKEYPPRPPNHIDPKDGHIWRAKYCILEEGVLYFYPTAEEGESNEARVERLESREQERQLSEEIVLGEVYVHTSSPGRAVSSFAGAGGAGGGHTMRQRSMLGGVDYNTSRKEMYDLSKSPMPMGRYFDPTNSPFHRRGSSVLTSSGGSGAAAGGSGSSPSLRHSSSTNTFHQEANILWEKRVALDCVGAVRSSQQEHGSHAFELLAYGSDDYRMSDDQSDEASTRASGSSAGGGVGGGPKNEIIDRLILRAGSSDDMNAWMFEFYRSLESFMQQMVNSVGKGTTDGRGSHMLGSTIRPDSPNHHRFHGMGNNGGGASPYGTTKSSFASSPSGNNSVGGGGSFVGSLSHGHGRNALYRRQVRDNKSSGSNASVISPLPTPVGTPVGGSSPVDYRPPASDESLSKKKTSPPSGVMIQSDSTKLKNKVDLSSLRGLRGEGTEKEPAPVVAATAVSAAPAPKKYVPPHMRNAAPKKYVPPHLRRKLAADSGSNNGISNAKDPEEKRVPLNDSPKKSKEKGDSCEAMDDTLSESALSGTSTSSLLSRQLTEESVGDVFPASTNVRLGGCADPTVVVGSILDHHYVDRKASVVGNARLEAYGGVGGGSFASWNSSRMDSCGSEEESMLQFDDTDDGPNSSPRRRSVLKWEVGASSECGVRNSNEDAYVVINDLDELIISQGLMSFSQQDLGQTKQQGLYAIFDGHVGNQAARFSAEKFHEMLIEEQSSLASRDSASLSSIEEKADYILRKAFDRLDRDFCNLCTADGRNWDSGSTALVAHIVDDVVSLANLGDCRGVVCRLVSGNNGSDVSMQADHGWEVLDPPLAHADDPGWDRANGGGDAYNNNLSGGKILWKEVTDTHSPLCGEELARIEKANGWIIKETEIPIGQLHRMDIFDEDVVEIVKRCFANRMKQHRSDPVRQIQIARTCGDLAVSRAIGDRDFKAAYNMLPNNTPERTAETKAGEQTDDLARSWEGPIVFLYPEGHSGRFRGDIVSSIPDIQTFRVGQDDVEDEFLLMACDGLWDVMDSDDAVRIAKNLLFDKEMSAKDGAARLAELAQHLGSSDNITVILIRFYWEEKEETEEST